MHRWRHLRSEGDKEIFKAVLIGKVCYDLHYKNINISRKSHGRDLPWQIFKRVRVVSRNISKGVDEVSTKNSEQKQINRVKSNQESVILATELPALNLLLGGTNGSVVDLWDEDVISFERPFIMFGPRGSHTFVANRSEQSDSFR